jgi:hypothetical protein
MGGKSSLRLLPVPDRDQRFGIARFPPATLHFLDEGPDLAPHPLPPSRPQRHRTPSRPEKESLFDGDPGARFNAD